jgi:hypothetical protein
MDYTLSVFKNEANIKDVKREELSKKVGVKNPDSSKALLISLMNQGGSSSVAKVDDSAELQKKKE